MTERLDTVVIGAGQAGLAAGAYLARYGREFVIFDAHARIGESWRRRWDSLLLFTPAAISGLPGLPFPAPPRAFPGKEQMADYLQTYAETFNLPVRLDTCVRELTRRDGRFLLDLEDGSLEADSVIVATGALRAPRRPAFADELDSAIQQFTVADYRNSTQVAPGPVLVVGAGNSGVEIATELAATHLVWLAGRHPGHFPFNPTGPVFWRLAHHLLTVDSPAGRWLHAATNDKGTPVIRSSPRKLAKAGIERLPRVEGHSHGLPLLADGRTLRPAAIVWATGFGPEYDWINLPAFDQSGTPRHTRGVSVIPGLYFVGLPFQYSFTSELGCGVGRDAEYVVRHITGHVGSEVTV
ncbi:NAD(P)/FAD-dependent oxidoreductase [Streptomyces sp. RB6PN25]|uniref:NAD(P)/FAD-dependent oxidoreductase n=1 Tax=Streptomyces humicola TaxID=2953240 RepID=A0ABT1PNQ3_9ACTN|nr:NAD(P)/FAD-dependent oxidoreductase [Streptomyces humicola]MCQ4079307.1 NAD(P)/FAD-dependent oxidoreductase [Streptomyces humicola]